MTNTGRSKTVYPLHSCNYNLHYGLLIAWRQRQGPDEGGGEMPRGDTFRGGGISGQKKE